MNFWNHLCKMYKTFIHLAKGQSVAVKLFLIILLFITRFFFFSCSSSSFLFFALQIIMKSEQAASLTFILNNVHWDESWGHFYDDLPSTQTQSAALSNVTCRGWGSVRSSLLGCQTTGGLVRKNIILSCWIKKEEWNWGAIIYNHMRNNTPLKDISVCHSLYQR